MARGRWREAAQFCYFDYPIRDLAGSTLGIIGDGALGKSVAKLGEAFGMKVLFSDYKGTTGMGPLYTPFWDVLRSVRRDHAAHAAAALDPQPDRRGRVRGDGAQAAAHQHRARRPGRRGGAGRGPDAPARSPAPASTW